MKLGSKKHLQNPKLPTVGLSARFASGARGGGIQSPKDFVPRKVAKSSKKK
jgi:hypothetical protein